MEVLGIDIGFGFTKATNGRDFVIYKSILGEAADIQFKLNIDNSSVTSNLHISIDDKSYFIGDYAEQQSNVRQFTLDQEKLITEFVKLLALTSVGLLHKGAEPVNIVSGLPVGFLKHYYKKFTKILSGQHNITFHKPDGKKDERIITINKIRMMPQPLGSIFNLLMDERGKIIDKDLTTQKIGVVDVGFRTTDFTIFDRLRYVERGSSTIDQGVSKSFSIIAKKLREESGVTIELYRLYDAVKSGFIKIRGQEFNISKLRDQVFQHSAGVIANEINRLWAEDWDMDAIVLTGGGSHELSKFLRPLVTGNVMPASSAVDARLNNVMGYLKFGKYEWGGSTGGNKTE